MKKISRRKLLGYGAAAGVLAMPHVARAQAIRLVFSHHVPTTHISHKTAEMFAEMVNKGTNGQYAIDIRPASQLFNLRTSAEALQLGTLDFCWTDLGTLANWQPQFGFTSVPFLFNDYDHVKKVLYGPVGQGVVKDVKDTLGIETLFLGVQESDLGINPAELDERGNAAVDDDGVAVVVDLDAAPEDKVILAAQGCPTQAIRITRDGERLV